MARYVIEDDVPQPGRYQGEEPGLGEKAGDWIRDTLGPCGLNIETHFGAMNQTSKNFGPPEQPDIVQTPAVQ